MTTVENATFTEHFKRISYNMLENELSTVTVLILTFLVNLLLMKNYFVRKKQRSPPGPWGLPVLGHLPFFGPSPPKTFARWQQTYGHVFRIRLGSWRTVVLNGYDVIKEAADKGDDFSGRPGFVTQDIIKSLNGETSFAFGPFNDEYLHRRKIVTSALRMFTTNNKKLTEELIVEEANRLVLNLVQKGKLTTPIAIKDEIQYAVGSIVYQFLYGRGKPITNEHLRKMVDGTNKFIKFTGNGNPFDVMPWLKYVMPSRISRFTAMLAESGRVRRQQIQDHVDTFTEHILRDMADALIAADIGETSGSGQRISRSRLLATLGDLQGAGFDTTNKTLQWLILYMATFPRVQTKVQAEIDEVVGAGRHLTSADKPALVYTEATITEVLRLAAITPFGLPKFTTCDTTIGGYDINKDTVVFFNQFSSCYELDFWGDPEAFRPERFITDGGKLDQTKISHVMTFGLGRRRCVGEAFARLQVFVVFSTLMQRCRFVNPRDVVYDLDPVPGLVYSPKDFLVIVKER